MTSASAPAAASAAGLTRVYLHPGQVFASAEPAAVSTILGSCVAVCLWDPATGIGGMNHFLLPQSCGTGSRSPRFAAAAIETLLERLLALGALRPRLEAKVFGGACLNDVSGRRKPLGEQNVDEALAWLRQGALPVTARSTGGRRGRKLVFHTADGTAWVREL